MVERKACLANPKHQYHVSQYEEQDCSANEKKNGEYYDHPCLSHSRMNFDHEENRGRKDFLAHQKNQ